MMQEFLKFLSKKFEEVPFITLFLFVFGAALMVTGTIEKIAILGQSFVIKDEFRWIILVVGIVFILAGIAKEWSPVIVRNGHIPPLYTFHGLKPELSCHAVFQDFVIDRAGGTNRNAVYYMWADTYGHNTINASIELNNNDDHYLHIIFNNNDEPKKNFWLSNIAIHPISEQALDNGQDGSSKNRYRFLKISARVQKNDSVDLEEIGIVIRVCDKNLTYWEYADTPGEFKQIYIKTGKWQSRSVDLQSKNSWQKFKSDGNRENPSIEPDFSVISGLTLILGGYNNNGQTPTPGKGIIDIDKIYLSNNRANA